MSVKYPNVLKKIEELEKVTYFHDDNAKDVYDSIMAVVKAAKPKNEQIEREVISETLNLLKEFHYEEPETDEDEYDEL